MELLGSIQRIWERSGSVYFRLEIPSEMRIDTEVLPLQHATCRLATDLTAQLSFSLLPGDSIKVIGYLVDSPYQETLQQFLISARVPDFLSSAPDRGAWEAVQVPRISTLVEILQVSAPTHGQNLSPDQAVVQGVIVKVWERSGHVLARLAIYDAYTRLTGQNGNRNRPRRIPHYITILFPEGRVGGRPIHIEPKTRLRVAGGLLIQPYRETLREILLRSRNLVLLEGLANSDRVADISAQREATYVVARSAIVFANALTHSNAVSPKLEHLFEPKT